MKFDGVILIQSYPNILDVKDYIDNTCRNILVISILDKNIQKFLKYNAKSNIEFIHFGHYIYFRKRIFRLFLPLYIFFIYLKIPRIDCKKLIITYHNWCDFGALPLSKVCANEKETWVSFCEDRYNVSFNYNSPFPFYIKLINKLSNNLVVPKSYLSYVKGNKVKLSGFGLRSFERNIVSLDNSSISNIPT